MEACRRDQPYLIEEIQEKSYKDKPDEFADFINGVTDSMGNHALHICAAYGSCKTSLPPPALAPGSPPVKGFVGLIFGNPQANMEIYI